MKSYEHNIYFHWVIIIIINFFQTEDNNHREKDRKID